MIITLKKNRYDYLIILTIVSVILINPLLGPFTPAQVFGFLYLLYHMAVVKTKRRIIVLTCCFYGAVLYSLIAALWITDWIMYCVSFLTSLCHIGIFLLIYYSSYKAKKPVDSIFTGWLLFTVVNLLVSYWEIFTGHHTAKGQFQADDTSVSFDGAMGFRVYAAVTYGNYNSLSIVLMLCLFMLILYWEYTDNVRKKIMLIFLFVSIIGVELVNTSRGCLMALLFSVIPLYKVLKSGKIEKYILLILMLVVCGYIWYQYSDLIQFLVVRKLSERSDTSSDPRWILLGRGLSIAKDWFFMGSGPGSQIYEYGKKANWVLYAHNMWIQSLVEYGLLITSLLFYGIARLALKCFFSGIRLLRLIGLELILCWPILTIVDEEYLNRKIFHWIFFASLLSIYHLYTINKRQSYR